MNILRILKHLCGGPWQVHRAFSRASLQSIEATIKESERLHLGELRFVVESVLPWQHTLRGVSARQRAVELFSGLRLWDTEQNSGVLIYLLLTDHDVEIVADRGIHAKVGEQGWLAICSEMEQAFRAGRFEQGVLAGIARISALLTQHFPAQGANRNELSDTPIVL